MRLKLVQRTDKRSRLRAFGFGLAHLLDFNAGLVRNRGRFAEGLAGDARAIRHDWVNALRKVDPEPR